jgi:hypothetical protein
MKRTMLTATAAAAALFSAMPINADDGGNFRKWRFGAQVMLAEPLGGLANVSSTGIGYSPFFVERSLGKKNNMAFRLSQDFISFNGKDGWNAFGFGPLLFDFLYRFSSNDVGAYVHAGTGIRYTLLIVTDIGFGGSRWPFVYSAGAGYNFNRHFGVEAKYSTQRDENINSNFPYVDKPGNIEYLQLGTIFRF